MKNQLPTILIESGKQLQKYIQNYFVDFADASVVYFDSIVDIDRILNEQEIALFIIEIDNTKKISSKLISNLKKKNYIQNIFVLYVTQKSIENFNLLSEIKPGFFDVLQLPLSKEIFTNKIKLFLQFYALQKDSEISDQKLSKSSSIETERNILESEENLSKEVAHHIRTKLDLQEKVQRIDDSSHFLELLIESIPIPLFIKNNKGEFIKCNKAFENFIGYNRENFLGKTIHHLSLIEFTDKIHRLDLKIIKSGESKTYEDTYKKTDGSIVNTIVHLNVFKNKLENESGLIGIIVDITEIKRAEKLLKIESTIDYLISLNKGIPFTLKNIMNHLMELEWIDIGGIYLFNEKKQELNLVYSSGASKAFTQTVETYGKNTPQMKLVLKRKPFYGNFQNFVKNNQFKVREDSLKFFSVIPLINTESDDLVGCLNLASRKYTKITEQDKMDMESIAKRLVRLMVYAQSQNKLKELTSKLEVKIKERTKELVAANKEISKINQNLEKRIDKAVYEQKLNQQYLLQKSKLESLGELSAGIAHEINQPLGVMALSLENLQGKIGTKHATKDYLANKFNSIEDNIKKIRQIIDHIRTFSRDQELPAMEKVNLNKVANKALSLIGTQYMNLNINIKLDLKEKIGFTIGSNIQVEQVILNLLSNAKYAIEDRATFMDEMEFTKEIIIRTDSTEKNVILEIEDNGTGIGKIDLPKIYDPFYTTKPEGFGTGVGLSIAYGIIKSMRGEIEVKTKKDNYTKFKILFPKFPEND